MSPNDEIEEIDYSFDSVELIVGEIHALMRRLMEVDPDSMLRLEALYAKMRAETVVDRHFH